MAIEVQNLTNVVVDGQNFGSVVQVARERSSVNISDLQTAVLAWFSAFKAEKQARIDELKADKDALILMRDAAVADKAAIIAAAEGPPDELAAALAAIKLTAKEKRRLELLAEKAAAESAVATAQAELDALDALTAQAAPAP